MSHKHRLKEIHDKLKEAANQHPENTQLHDALNELHAEITAMADAADSEDDGSGGNHPTGAPGTP